MSDQYGGMPIPAPPFLPGGFPDSKAVGDNLLGYLGSFLQAIIAAGAGDLWQSVQPGKPIIRNVFTNDPDEDFVESGLPALYVFRPPKETREVMESFDQIADDYLVQKGRVVAIWIFDPLPIEQQRQRGNIIDAVRKAVSRAIHIGRDPSWIVPGDTDPASPTYDSKAALFGSGLLPYSGASVIELRNAAPGKFNRKMALPAPIRHYFQLRMSFEVEEFLDRDLDLNGEPHLTLEADYVSPDQGTGLGNFDLGSEIYD